MKKFNIFVDGSYVDTIFAEDSDRARQAFMDNNNVEDFINYQVLGVTSYKLLVDGVIIGEFEYEDDVYDELGEYAENSVDAYEIDEDEEDAEEENENDD